MKRRVPLIALAVAVVLQATLVPYLGVHWFRPDLPLLVIIFIASRFGPFDAVITGFLAGIAVDSLTTSFFGLSSMCYSLSGFVVGKFFYSDVSLPLSRWSIASGAGAFVYGLPYAYFFSLHAAPPFITLLVSQALPVILYTWALGMLFAFSPFYDRRTKVKL